VKKPVLAALALSALALLVAAPMHAQAPTPTQAPPAAQDKPAKPDQKINGKWHFVFDTQGGDREFNAEFTVDADGNVTGTWDKSPATGTYKDGHLLMAFDTYSEEANETATLHLDGKFDDTDTLTGNWTFSSYDGTFKATHPKP
jgi:hypothetical protein